VSPSTNAPRLASALAVTAARATQGLEGPGDADDQSAAFEADPGNADPMPIDEVVE
jgi:hypothetical protein